MELNLVGLNSRQMEAVSELDRSVLVMAGAGSGKTSVLTMRIGNLIASGKAFPDEILVFTFTNKAAEVVRTRLIAMNIPGIRTMWTGTFHSICVRILRQHAKLLGYEPNFAIYDTTDQKALAKKVIKELDLSYDPKDALSIISNYKNGSRTWLKDIELELIRRYNDELKSNNCMDFDDLILNVIRLLEDFPEVRRSYTERFRYIHIDEYQDTNSVQFRLVKLLCSEDDTRVNVFAVGDIDQSIYKWRGANIKNIQNFERDFSNSKLVVLEQNYRSTLNILNAANSVIQNNTNRPDKNLWSDKGDGEKIRYYRAATDREEAIFVSQEIEKLHGDYDYKHFAVLYRNNAQSRQLELEFRNRGIPYNVYGGHKFFDRKEIKDMLAYLRLAYNPADNISFERVINTPKRGIGATSLEKLYSFADKNKLSLINAALRAEEISGIKKSTQMEIVRFAQNMLELSAASDVLGIDELFRQLLSVTRIIELYEKEGTTEADSRIDNIYEFQSYVNENAGLLNLREFLEDTALRSDQDDMDYDDDKVTLMTIHSAKGLEYEVVFIVGFGEEILPSARSKDDQSQLEEERRLCYVAITRAKELLYITNMQTRYMYGDQPQRIAPSRFLGEIPLSYIKNMGGGSISAGDVDFSSAFSSRGAGYGGSGFSESDYGRSVRGSSGYGGAGFGKVKTPALDKRSYLNKGAVSKADYRAGDKVVHDAFGEGIVVEVEKEYVRVAFDDNGIKKLSAKLAPMKKK